MSEQHDNEVIYKIIPDFPDYRVGADGSVWSKIMRHHPGVWRRRKPGVVPPHGYLFVPMVGVDRKTRTRYIHRLVLEAFVGPCPEGMLACHNDGNPANNALSNLRWDTQSNNNLDRRRHGTAPLGSKHVNAKLTEEHVQAVMVLRGAGWSLHRIAMLFNVSVNAIHFIDLGRTWTHVEHANIDEAAMEAVLGRNSPRNRDE